MECYFGCGDNATTQLKNGKLCCSDRHQKCPAIRAKNSASRKGIPTNPNLFEYNQIKVSCQYCDRQLPKTNIKRHTRYCWSNPKNIRLCPVCSNQIKSKYNETCSHGCANTFFRSGPNHGNWSGENYRSVCFYFHKKECIVCREVKIVEVHHYDFNHDNNDPENLVPLCPTHHQYVHSRYKDEIILLNEQYKKTRI